MEHYADDVILFDIRPPFQMKGAKDFRQVWKMCLPYFPESFEIETPDLAINATDDMAVAHRLLNFTGISVEEPGKKSWLRETVVYKRIANNKWQIVHAHGSAPFDPQTLKVVLTPET